ncbi:Scr1 family TA system antitoxin-like transcriptional regulator [Streptomyces sp. HB2AG]|uniref:Scr1 family TA system antitoxin-like transcriptional regulator n=1 Tax=Streptomyces sp. HB2AG TaxID=2983400 RepID=UPI0022AA7DD4|nr:Scr1 family TA system antitoxin-like transcriptional regulator [Streptomyces sp. HB2AG]MCZ2525665.1 Scr1 family TA system antitoxin-like transcriptional regulator [Streptomyces sp. HB2AG]
MAARLGRQELLNRRPAPTLSFVIDEAALRRPIGGTTVWRGRAAVSLSRTGKR